MFVSTIYLFSLTIQILRIIPGSSCRMLSSRLSVLGFRLEKLSLPNPRLGVDASVSSSFFFFVNVPLFSGKFLSDVFSSFFREKTDFLSPKPNLDFVPESPFLDRSSFLSFDGCAKNSFVATENLIELDVCLI